MNQLVEDEAGAAELGVGAHPAVAAVTGFKAGEGVEIRNLGNVVHTTGGPGRSQVPLPVPLSLGVHSYNLPSEVNLSSGGDTPWLRDVGFEET